MKNRLLLAATCSGLLLSGLLLPGGQAANDATLYRDEFGIPHVYAPTLESAAFAVGYAQAQDRLEELLKNYRRANGTMAEVFGPSHFRDDLVQRLFRHEEISRQNYGRLSPKTRAVIEAYQAGIKYFMKEHPEQVPGWAQAIHPWDVVALGRFIIWGWPLGEAGGDLRRAGIQPDELPYRGSNEILLGPSRTAMKTPVAIIDPHLSWYGEFRFYQVRIYAGDFNASGVCILGTPLPSLGHSRYCSIAMTTGGPDTSDVFAEELNPANPRQYRYDGQWRDLLVRKVRLGVKRGDQVDWQEPEIQYSHHGPIVAHQQGKAYAMAIPYADEVGLTDQIYQTMTARNLAEMKRALAHLQLMAQNIMVATVQGDIYYVRNGRVPIRPPGTDPSRPIPGALSTNEWRGIHPFSDLVQLENPPQAYMHNNNVTPFAMMKDSPLTPEKYARFPYLYNATRNAPRHQRADMMTELLDAAHDLTVEGATALAFNSQVYHAELWQERLQAAWSKAPDADRQSDAAEVCGLIQQWDRHSDADSAGALAYYAFKKGLAETSARAVDPPSNLTDEEMLAALAKAAAWLKTNFGSLHVPYGRFFRVGREGGQRTYPVSGGSVSDAGMATVRAVGFSKAGREMVGRSGQTSTQVVIMTDPPESYTLVPLGVSDHKESGHWDDQAEKLFSKGQATPTYFLNRAELLKHVTATTVLTPSKE
ncbi:MAG: penicillin acylase family protein [Verrucomicrobiota bacterium]|jgi:acyl-homoserine lactone acylase PvdQ